MIAPVPAVHTSIQSFKRHRNHIRMPTPMPPIHLATITMTYHSCEKKLQYASQSISPKSHWKIHQPSTK
ncbi:hypothetical protein EYC84_004365 [Monilinia fructicola]|uniref:Uncharacterized protein n=1 Tax=Monilinia fructicola TaxID=38448 RepID=A0A5M9K040_MONFR|nr:hypothetical protein EYC84_004365 [Monilinia fructicola]